MGNESGTWVMYGVEPDDPECIHTVEEAIAYINEVGFLPLFKNEIPGFSLEERTVAEHWWSENPAKDPWEWRAMIARKGEIAYGKFFDGKAGFISKKWLPYFVNYRRDGYDFDALWGDEKASRRQKKIMSLFEEDNAYAELFSYEIKQKAGFGKEGEKGFEGTISNLQMLTYLCVRDFRQKKNKKGQAYGWAIAVYATPEHIWGYDYVTSAYHEKSVESGKRIAKHMMDMYPSESASQIKKLIGVQVGEAPEKKATKKVNYPQNLLKAMKLNIKSPTDDQLLGLEFAIGQLKESCQEVIRLHYEKGLTYKEVGEQTGKSSSRCGQISRMGMMRLQCPNRMQWIIDGYQGRLEKITALAEKARMQFLAEGKNVQADMMIQSPDTLPGITAQHAKLLMNVGIGNIGILREVLKEDFWTRTVPGIGHVTGEKIVYVMYRVGIIDESFESYKEARDRDYYLTKCVRMREEEDEIEHTDFWNKEM